MNDKIEETQIEQLQREIQKLQREIQTLREALRVYQSPQYALVILLNALSQLNTQVLNQLTSTITSFTEGGDK